MHVGPITIFGWYGPETQYLRVIVLFDYQWPPQMLAGREDSYASDTLRCILDYYLLPKTDLESHGFHANCSKRLRYLGLYRGPTIIRWTGALSTEPSWEEVSKLLHSI